MCIRDRVITLGSLLAEVPHSRPVLIHGVSEDDEMNEKFDLQRSSYEGPTGIVGVLNQVASVSDIPNISLWATVPNYVAGAESPKAALALIEKVLEVVPLAIHTTDLEIASAAYERQINQIVEELKTLTLLEASELVSQIEETFGVDASAAGGGAMVMAAAAPTEEVEEKTEYDVVLEEVPADKKIAILKVVRSLTGLGLKEAKEMVESAPKQIAEGMAKDAAEAAQKDIEAAGGKASLT